MPRIATCAIPILLALAATPVGAAEIKVISAGAVRGLIGGMIAEYSQHSGDRFDFKTGTTGQLRAIIASGEPADLIIASAPLMAELEASGRMMPHSRADLGRVGLGVAIREGAAAFELPTADAFKRLLVEVRSLAYSDPRQGGQSGIHLVGVLAQLGIADLVAGKTVLTNGGHAAVEKVAKGEAEIAVTFMSEIVAVKGASLAAPLPQALQLYSLYAAAIPASSKEPAAARAFIAALAAPAMAPRWTAAGFEPPR